jgi:hypothetical protein
MNDKLEPSVTEVLDKCIAIRESIMAQTSPYVDGMKEISQLLKGISPRAYNADDVYGHYAIHYRGYVWIHIDPDGSFGFWYMLGKDVERGE